MAKLREQKELLQKKMQKAKDKTKVRSRLNYHQNKTAKNFPAIPYSPDKS